LTGPANEGRNPQTSLRHRPFFSTQFAIAGSLAQLAAIVAAEEDEGLLRDPFLLERGENPPQSGVEILEIRQQHGAFAPATAGVLLARRGLQRAMHGIEGKIAEERAGCVARLNQPDHLVGQQVGREPLFFHRLSIPLPVELIAVFATVGRVIDRPVEMSVEVVESPGHRQVLGPIPLRIGGTPQVPFAAEPRLVTRLAQALG